MLQAKDNELRELSSNDHVSRLAWTVDKMKRTDSKQSGLEASWLDCARMLFIEQGQVLMSAMIRSKEMQQAMSLKFDLVNC